MRIRLIILPFLFCCFLANSQADSEEKRYGGFEIYFLKEYKGSDRSYWDFDSKEQREFAKDYKRLNKIPDSICNWYIDLAQSKIEQEPFLSHSDIEYYLPSAYRIRLTESGIKKISELKADVIPVSGIPFIIVAKNKKLIGAWFWSSYSSNLCDRVYIQINEQTKETALSFGFCGIDPRNGKAFLNELTELD